MKEDSRSHSNREYRYQLAGWILFIFCALFFIAASFRNHDTLSLIGSVIFLVACLFFVVPLLRPGRRAVSEDERREENKIP